jgi:hypothetical protein
MGLPTRTCAALLIATMAAAPATAPSADPSAAPTTAPTTGPAVPSGDPAAVAALLTRMSAPDPDDRARAAIDAGWLPAVDLPLLEAAAAADELPPEASIALHQLLPVARQRAKLARREADRWAVVAAVYERTALADYDAGAYHNPKWDDAARAFLRATNRRYAHRTDATGPQLVDEAKRQFKLAMDAKCNDPTVLTCGGLLLDGNGGTPAEVAKLFARADKAPWPRRAGPLFQSIVYGRLLRPVALMDDKGKEKAWGHAMDHITDMERQFAALLALPGMQPIVAVQSATNAFDRSQSLYLPLQPFLDHVLNPLLKAYPHDPDALCLKGKAYVAWAWEARGGGWANTVTAQGWKDMAARLDKASVALTRAWDLDPDDADIATEMISVELGRAGDHAVMDTWFKRAMTADPDCYAACTAKLYFLEPKWHGSPDEMLAFGRECATGGTWGVRMPGVLIDAHIALAAYEAKPDDYWLAPGVWDDVVRVYADRIRLYPDDSDARAYYAKFAYKCHQWRVLNEQLAKLGKDANPAMFGDGTPAALEAARQTAARLADDPAAQGR